MKLSIIVPVYNVERYVERCLRSILSQGVPSSDYEIIIQNDGSTDGSLAIVERVVSGHENCLVFSSNNRGQSAARNAALCHAKGEYVWFVDSDDWIEEGCLPTLLSEISKSHADLYNFGYKSSLNNKVSVSAMPATDMGLVGVCGHLYKREFLNENKLVFVEGLTHEDYEFSPRVAFLAKKIVNLDIAPYIVYKRPNSITTSANPKKAFDMLTVVRSLANFQAKHEQEGCDFTELIAQGLNNSLQTVNMFNFSREVERELDGAFVNNKDLLAYFWKSKRMKYKLEYVLFSLVPNHCVGVFKLLKKFSKSKMDMESVTNKVIILEEQWGGHRYEYLKNIYVKSCEFTDTCTIFAAPYDDRLKEWHIENQDSVIMDYLSDEDLKKLNHSNLLKASYYRSKLVCKYVRKYQATHVFLIFLMLYMPFLLWVLPRSVKVSGIVYRSFLWEDSQKKGRLRRCLEWMRYWLMAKSSKMEKVLLLNDSKSADTFNKRFATGKFMRLPDPYSPLEGVTEDVRTQLLIDTSDNLFIQIGQLSGRKGTLEILDALNLLSSHEMVHNHFYFAGKVAEDIRNDFYMKTEELKSKGVHIYVKDEFVSFGFLNSLCASCDCMLVPYKNTSQSSGAIGYAAQYGKPVIGPSKGLLGYLIKHYGLGCQIKEISAGGIYAAISNFKRTLVSDNYVRDNQLSDFLKLCLNER